MNIASITSQGQVTVPVKVRRALGLKKGGKVNFSLQNNKVVMEPVKDLLELAGTFRTNKKPLTNKQLHEKFGRYMAFRKKRSMLSK